MCRLEHGWSWPQVLRRARFSSGRAITRRSVVSFFSDAIRPGERSIKRFDDLHAAAAARARGRFVVGNAGAFVIIVIAMRARGWHIEQSLTERELVSAR